MGAADVVPGVSGGTIAFIAGIYDRLIESISALKPNLIRELLKGNFKKVWTTVNGSFLVTLLAGIGSSIFSLARLITYLMQYYPIHLWAFFFGLILASILYVGKQIKHWNMGSIMGLILGTLSIIYISIAPPLSPQISYIYLFFSGALAACAMILPGISGSFILLLLGAYTTIMSAIGHHDFLTVGIVAMGAAVGLVSFSKLLNYLLKNFHNTLLGILTGFLVGSLWKIWPWKIDESVYLKGQGVVKMAQLTTEYQSLSAYLRVAEPNDFKNITAYVEHNISPFAYTLVNHGVSHHLFSAGGFCIIGFSLIFTIEYIAKIKNV